MQYIAAKNMHKWNYLAGTRPSLISYPVEDRDEHGGGGDDDDDRDDEAGDQQEDGIREVLWVRPVRSATE